MLAAALAALVLPASVPADIATITIAPQAETRLVLAATGNEARYRVREQLAGVDFPNDAVGATSAITGEIVIGDNGEVIAERSKITVDLRTLKSDRDRRDGFIQRRTLETENFPTAELVVTRITGLANPLPTTGQITVTLVGNLTVHGTTRGTTWQVTATASPGGYRGTARTEFTFADFELTKPRVASVLSVDDKIGLEFDFNFERR